MMLFTRIYEENYDIATDFCYDISQASTVTFKGVLAWESHTGTWLVSPATGCEKKKMEVSTTGPQITKLSTLEHILYILGLGLNRKWTGMIPSHSLGLSFDYSIDGIIGIIPALQAQKFLV